MDAFVRLGGTVIDTAPSYGTAEDVLGLILSEGDLRRKVSWRARSTPAAGTRPGPNSRDPSSACGPT